MFGSKRREKFPNIDWYCDNCNDHLNNQPGFYDDCTVWSCVACGHTNFITEDEIIWDEDFDNNSFSERLSVDDAALIWLSYGKDEDYMFGYSAQELEDTL